MKGLKRGKLLPDVSLIDYYNNNVSLDSIITKPTVLYFWSSSLPMLMKNSHYKVSQLKTKFPEIDFIGININDDDPDHWKHILHENDFPVEKEYQFKDANEGQEALSYNFV